MKFRFSPSLSLWAAGVVGIIGVACNSGGAVTAPAPAPAATEKPSESAAPAAYDSNQMMYRIFPGFGFTSERTFEAFEQVRQHKDTSLVPVLVESMRFQSSKRARAASAEVLSELTGQDFGGEQWLEWSEWLGKHRDEFPPPSDYLDWKMDMLSQIDSRFAQFLRPAREGQITIDPTELVWGGVLPDGIPDLRDPRMIQPDEADYLAPDERVFGISIKGDSRAYPLRITNAHEMVNDTVGGEPVALSW